MVIFRQSIGSFFSGVNRFDVIIESGEEYAF